MAISVILGAGFSYNSGLPLLSGVSEKFLQRPLENHTLYFGSGEWKWNDWANAAEMVNGRIHGNGQEIAFLMAYLIDHYMATNEKKLLNYEEFYQFLYDTRYFKTEEFERLLNAAEQGFRQCYPGGHEVDFDQLPDYEIFSCLYHLIEDLLWIRKPYAEFRSHYEHYIHMFQLAAQEINIFTLNHDLLLEKIFAHDGIAFSDGFGPGTLFGDNGNALPVFVNQFTGPVNLIKLHGSIDMYKYRYVREANRHKGYDYFKTLDFRDKQTANDVDSEENVLQNFTPQIIPRFITGANKLAIMQSDKMYSALYNYFEQVLPQSDKLLIAGYSYQDAHVNAVIEKSLRPGLTVININPYDRFPYAHEGVVEIEPGREKFNYLFSERRG